MTIFSLSFTFFLLMDSVGNIPLYISLLQELPQKRQLYIIFREMVIALLIMILFYVAGDGLLNLLNVSQDAVQMAGGIILFLIALKMIFPPPKDTNMEIDEEPFIVPLAVPLIAGPSILATIIIYSHQEYGASIILTSLFIAWALSLIILLGSPFLQRILGKRGIKACERLMGLILILLGIEMFLKGIALFIGRCTP